MVDAVIVDAVRTPIGRRNGALAGVHPVELTAHVLPGLVERSGLEPDLVDDVIWGCVTQIGDQSSNVGRLGVLAAGLAQEVIPGTTVDRACGSSQQALHFAAAGVMSGQYDVVIAGGVESMSRVPIGSARKYGEPYGPSIRSRYGTTTFSQGEGAEIVAQRWGLDRRTLDEFALLSHERAAAAWARGAFDGQVLPVSTESGSLTTDEGIRRDTTIDRLGALPGVPPDGVIHAGNASQISDGAAALLITSSDKAAELGLTPVAAFRAGVAVGDDPVTMLTAPIPATAKVLKRAALDISDIGAFEINEAFASVPLAWLAETGAVPELLNPLGGAIAVGHPLGGSGAILLTRLIHHMRDRGIRYGLQAMCEAGGMANATVIELLAPANLGPTDRGTPRRTGRDDAMSWLSMLLGDSAAEHYEREFQRQLALDPAADRADLEAEARRALTLRAQIRSLRSRANELAVLNDLAGRLVRAGESDTILRVVAQQARLLINVELAYIVLDQSGHLVVEVQDGATGPFLKGQRVFKDGPAGQAVSSGAPVQFENFTDDPGTAYVSAEEAGIDPEHAAVWSAQAREEQFRGVLAVPITTGEETLGALCAVSRHPRVFNTDEVAVMTALAAHAAVALRNAAILHSYREQAKTLQAANERLTRLDNELKSAIRPRSERR